MSDDRKKDEECVFLQTLLSVGDIHYIIYDRAQQKYKASQSLSDMLEISMDGDIKNIKVLNYIDKACYLKLLESLNKSSDKFEMAVNYNNKKIFFVVQSYQLNIENSSKYFYIFIDITAIKEIERESKQRDTLMFQQAKMAQMGEMISMIAHQWRQPINAISASSIKLSLSNTLGKLTPDGVEEHAEFVQNQCQKMSNVIDSFLSYSSNRSEEKNFHIRDVIKTIHEFVSVQYSAHNIKIVIDIDDTLDDTIFGREDMLEQVLLNLLSNAKDAFDISTQENEKSISIRYIKPKEIVIEDNAGGVDDSVLDKLFVPYFTTKAKGKGTGLGLYMGKRIMNEHFNGDLRYKKIGNNSCFTITL